MNRQGNAAALLILIVGTIIILYLLALPPGYREQILGSVMVP